MFDIDQSKLVPPFCCFNTIASHTYVKFIQEAAMETALCRMPCLPYTTVYTTLSGFEPKEYVVLRNKDGDHSAHSLRKALPLPEVLPNAILMMLLLPRVYRDIEHLMIGSWCPVYSFCCVEYVFGVHFNTRQVYRATMAAVFRVPYLNVVLSMRSNCYFVLPCCSPCP